MLIGTALINLGTMRTSLSLILLITAIIAFTAWPAKAQRPRTVGRAVAGLQQPRTAQAAKSTFALTVPVQGAVLPAESNVTIQWTPGNNAQWTVNLSLVDVAAWQVAATVVSNIANSGSYNWMFPASLGCDKQYQFYIAETNNQDWNYGPQFTLQCPPPAYDIALVKQKTPTQNNFRIELTNVGDPITGPALISITDDLPAGVRITGGQGGGPGWTMSPGGAGSGTPGPAQIAITYTIPAGTTVPTGGQISWFVIQTELEVENCATAQLSINGATISETDVSNNSDCAQW